MRFTALVALSLLPIFAHAELVISPNHLIQAFGGSIRADIVAYSKSENRDEITFHGVELVDRAGNRYKFINQEYVSPASNPPTVGEMICRLAAPASYRYSASTPVSARRSQGVQTAFFRKDGSIKLETKDVSGYEMRSSVTCSRIPLQHVGE